MMRLNLRDGPKRRNGNPHGTLMTVLRLAFGGWDALTMAITIASGPLIEGLWAGVSVFLTALLLLSLTGLFTDYDIVWILELAGKVGGVVALFVYTAMLMTVRR